MPADNLANMSPEELLEMQKKNCIFCKIISHEIPSNEVYSDDKISVILDINPANEGHLLILPKIHYQILPQIPEDMIVYLSIMAKRASRVLLKAFGAKGTTVFIANGAMAGQKAPHFMMHVIPRKKNDMLFQLPKKSLDEKLLESARIGLSKKIASLMGMPPINIPPKQIESKHIQEQGPEHVKPEGSDTKDDDTVKSEASSDEKASKSKKMDLDKIAGLFG